MLRDRSAAYSYRSVERTPTREAVGDDDAETEALVFKMEMPPLEKPTFDERDLSASDKSKNTTKKARLVPEVVVSGDASSKSAHSVILAASYGLVAAAMCAPVMMSFTSIIFGDPFFSPYLPNLVKLVLFSSAVHQVCHVAWSTLPFAVGQVQDAGLIFLSAMARAIVFETETYRANNDETWEAVAVAATLWTLAVATACLGAMLVVVGRLRLASLAQYLPVPVVGGYLSYIGLYCGQAGLAMMAGVEIVKPRDYARLFSKRALSRVAPGFGVAALIRVVGDVARRRRMSRTAMALVVPAVLAFAVIVFYVVLVAGGLSLEDARRAGWVGEAPSSRQSSDDGDDGVTTTTSSGVFGWRAWPGVAPWTLYAPAGVSPTIVLSVVLRTAPKIVLTWLGMVAVVAFSSSLDVAAIEMELGRPLNYDAELRTVGLGNLVSGVLGGYSGSYIFSQTILNLRSKVATRLSGLVVALVELSLVFLCPVPPTAVAPTCAFGGTLLMIAFELLEEWLVKARHKFSDSEYFVALFTFVAINLVGLEAGFAAGLVAAALAFAANYGTVADASAVACDPSPVTRSVVMRDFEQRAALSRARHRGEIVVLELRGFVFFGAAAQLLAQFRKRLGLSSSSTAAGHASGLASSASSSSSRVHGAESSNMDSSLYASVGAWGNKTDTRRLRRLGQLRPPALGGGAHGIVSIPPEDPFSGASEYAAPRKEHRSERTTCSYGAVPPTPKKGPQGGQRRPVALKVAVLECRDFAGVDATAARACFLPLRRLLREAGAQLLWADIRDDVRKTLEVHGVELDAADAFPSLDAALEAAEDLYLARVESLNALETSLSSRNASPVITTTARRTTKGTSSEESGSGRKGTEKRPKVGWSRRGSGRVSPGKSLADGALALLGVAPFGDDDDDVDDDDGLDEYSGDDAAAESDDKVERLVQILSNFLLADASNKPDKEEEQPLVEEKAKPASQLQQVPSSSSIPTSAASPASIATSQETPTTPGALAASLAQRGQDLAKYFHRRFFAAGSTLFAAGEAPDSLFFVANGVVDFEMPRDADSRRNVDTRILRVTKGGVCGELNFFLKRPQRFSARAAEHCDAFVLSRDDADAMRAQDPDLFIVVQAVLLKTLCLQVEDSLGSFLVAGATSSS